MWTITVRKTTYEYATLEIEEPDGVVIDLDEIVRMADAWGENNTDWDQNDIGCYVGTYLIEDALHNTIYENYEV